MKIQLCLLTAIFAAALSCPITGNAQTVQERTAELVKPLHEANMKNMAEYNCNMALIEMDRRNILERLDGKILPPARFDELISKADECITSIGQKSLYYGYRARAQNEKGNTDLALADFEKAIALAKTEATSIIKLDKLHEDRADLYIRLGDRAKAESDLKQALKIDPSNYSAKDKLQNLDRKLADARKKRALENPQTADDYVVVGTEHYNLGNYPLAVAAFDRSIALAPSSAAHLGKGKALQAQERFVSAIVEMNKAVALAPKDSDTLMWRGYVNRDLKRWDEAIADFTAALGIAEPARKAAALNARGEAYTGMASYAEALKDHEAALAAAGDDAFTKVTALTGKAEALRGQGKVDDAIAGYAAAIAAAGNDYFAKLNAIPAWLGRGRAYASQGKTDLAKADFNTVLTLSKDSKEARAELAKLPGEVPPTVAQGSAAGPQTAEQWAAQGRRQAEGKDYDGAIKSFSECLRLKPDAIACRAFRGGAYGLKGDMAASRADFEKALAMDPASHGAIYFMRGMMHAQLGMKNEAVSDFQAVLRFDPNNAQAKRALQQLEVQP